MRVNTFHIMGVLSVAALTALPISPASAQVLTFEGLRDFEVVDEFYNGGSGSQGSVGPDYGVSFATGGNTFASIDGDAGGGFGNWANEPSPSSVFFIGTPAQAFMNVPAGFTTGFSLYYSTGTRSGSMQIFDGLDGTGNLLATLGIPFVLNTGPGDPTGDYSTWTPVGVAFDGTARSVAFADVDLTFAFDNLTLGSATPGITAAAPEPGALALLASGIGIVGLVTRRRTG